MDDKACISLYDNADRIVAVGEREDGWRLYKVSSLAMSMASTIWRAMFGPTNGFRESNTVAPVEFPEDDPDIMLIVLRIIHFRFDELPQSISFDQLVELAVFCDKYDTVSIVRPFIANWISPWTEHCLEPDCEHWLFVAWTFGCQKIFSTLANYLILSTELDNDQNEIEASNNWVHKEGMPPGIVGSILKIREDTIGKLMDLLDDVAESLVTNKGCNNIHNRLLCNAALLGLFLQSLYPIGLGFRPQKTHTAKVRQSVSTVARKLTISNQLHIHKVVETYDLNSRLRPKISKILQEIPSAVMESHIRHMEDQAKKSGIGYLEASGPRRR